MKPKTKANCGITAYLHRPQGQWLQQNIDRYSPRCPVVFIGSGNWNDSLFPVEQAMDARVATKNASEARNIEFLEQFKVAIGRHWEYFIAIDDTFRARKRNWDDDFVAAIGNGAIAAGRIAVQGAYTTPAYKAAIDKAYKDYLVTSPGGQQVAYAVGGYAIYNTRMVAQALGNHYTKELATSMGNYDVSIGSKANVVAVKTLAVHPFYSQDDVKTAIMAPGITCGGPITTDWQPDELLWEPGTFND